MPLKYAADLASRPDQPCPCPQSFRPHAITAFRLMRNPATDARDFEPPAIVDGGLKPRDKCGRLALSFFVSLEAARKCYAKLAERVDAAARYGDHVGKIDLVENDDLLQVKPSSSGHINLHQESGVQFAHRVKAYYRSEGDDDAT